MPLYLPLHELISGLSEKCEKSSDAIADTCIVAYLMAGADSKEMRHCAVWLLSIN